MQTQLKSKLTRKLNNLPSKKLPAEMYTVHERWALYWSWHNQIYNSLNDQLHIMIVIDLRMYNFIIVTITKVCLILRKSIKK